METRYTYKWFSLAILSLALGGGFAFLVAMSRTPFGYKYFPPGYMYHALAGHVVLAILLWLLSFTVVIWSLHFPRGGQVLNLKDLTPYLSLIGIILVTLSVLFSKGTAVTNNYVPTIIDPFFFAGLAIFFLGFSINVAGYFRESVRYIRSQDILLNTLSTSVLIALIMIGAMIYSLITHREQAEPFVYYERLFWTPGHIQQILNGALLVSVWNMLLNKIGAEGKSWGSLRYANLLLLMSSIFLLLLGLFIDPVDKASRIAAELTYTIGLGLPVFLHIADIVKRLLLTPRHADPCTGIFSRTDSITIYKGNKRVGYVALILSMAIYIAGITIAYSGFGNDLRVPAHYHGAVTSLTLALMGFSYYLVREFRQRILGDAVARVQPVIYGVGMFLFILGLFISGAFGAPRKTYGVAFTTDPVVLSALTIMGIGTFLAVIGGVMFVTYISMSMIVPISARVKGFKE